MTTVPESNNRQDWPRLVSQAVNRATNAIISILTRLGLVEAGVTTVEGDITALDGRTTALEGKTVYSVATVTFTPQTVPGAPVAGMTYFDSGTNKLRVYDGAIWNDCW